MELSFKYRPSRSRKSKGVRADMWLQEPDTELKEALLRTTLLCFLLQSFFWLNFLVAIITAASIHRWDLWTFSARDETFGMPIWDLLLYFAIALSVVSVALFCGLAGSPLWRVRRAFLLFLFIILCVGFPSLIRIFEPESYEDFQEMFNLAEKEYFEGLRAEGGEIDEDSFYLYDKIRFERLKETLEDYEKQRHQ